MKDTIEQVFARHRPKDFSGKGDRGLPQVLKELRQIIGKVQKTYEHSTCRLTGWRLDALSTVLVDFAEDIHNDLRHLWSGTFGTAALKGGYGCGNAQFQGLKTA